MSLEIRELLEVFNGSALMEAGHQEWGYIEEKWFLAVPAENRLSDQSDEAHKRWATYHPGESAFSDAKGGIIDKTKFLKANYILLKNAGLSDDHALLGALMRMTMIEMGALALSPHGRNVLVDEYVYYQPEGNNWDLVIIPKILPARDIAAWAKRFTPTIMSHIMFVFCARGHHWTPEFVDLYDRLYQNSFVGTPQGWAKPTSEVLYRSLLHCLGVAPLIAINMQLVHNNKLPAAMIIRYKPAPPIAGVAHITTLNAIIGDMHRHALWERIKGWKKVEIEEIENTVETIHDDPYAYHVASKVLCGKERKVISESAMLAFRNLAAIALGYVKFLGKKHSLSGQQAVTQKYGGVDPLVDMWSDAFDRFGLPSVSKLDVDTFFAEIMDSPEARQIRRERIDLANRIKNVEIETDLAQRMALLAEAKRRAGQPI